jgi:hypothetical protein
MVERRCILGDRCGRGLPQQFYEFDVEFRFNGPKVEQDSVLAYPADHGWIQPSQCPQQGLRLQRCVAKRYGGALQASRWRGSATNEAEDRNRFCKKFAGAHLAGNPFAPPENF